MLVRLQQLGTNLRASLWFLPGVMIIASVFLALSLIELDTRIESDWLTDYPRLFGLGADGSRGMLTAIASSMLTVAALAFSLTLNAVTQASAQFTPRIFRNFLRDRSNQFVLGYFVSVFVFCLIVLRTIRGGDELKFVPSIAVMAGLLFAIGGVLVLIFFIHHIANSLQITTILSNVTEETLDAIDHLFPEDVGEASTAFEKSEAPPIDTDSGSQKIAATGSGYVQNVDVDTMMELAVEHRVLIRMRAAIGNFVGTGATLAEVINDAGHDTTSCQLNEDQIDEIAQLFALDPHRTIEQDAGFGIRQIVDIALKALSPGINDTTTAVNCIDRLGQLTGELASRNIPSRVRSKDGVARVIVAAPDFDDYVATAFDQIRISGKGNMAVFARLLSALVYVAERSSDHQKLRAVETQINLIGKAAEQHLSTEYEKEIIAAKLDEARESLRK